MNILKAFRLDKKIVARLSDLAQKNNRSEKYFVEEALRQYFAEHEDGRIAKERFMDPKTRILSSKEMRKRLGV